MNGKTREVMAYILDTYGLEPEYPWMTSPQNAIFRNARNKKWFAVLLGSLPKARLGLQERGCADVLNVKCDPIMTFSLIDHKRIFRAYHMNKEHWVSILLDSEVTVEEIRFLLEMSYSLVDACVKAGRPKTE